MQYVDYLCTLINLWHAATVFTFSDHAAVRGIYMVVAGKEVNAVLTQKW